MDEKRKKKAIKGRRTVISVRGEDAEYLMPALREVEVARMRLYVCEWCGAEVGAGDFMFLARTKIWYCQNNLECEKKLLEAVEWSKAAERGRS